MVKTVNDIMTLIECVLEKNLMEVFNVIICVTVICIALFIVALIKSIHDGVFIDEDDDDIDYLDDDEYEDETWEYGKNENKN